MDEIVDLMIDAFSANDVASIKPDDWQRAELVGQLSHELDLMNGTQSEGLRRQKVVTSKDSRVVSLMELCTIKLQQSNPIQVVDAGHLLVKVDKFRGSLLSNALLDGKSRKWIQLWLLCHKLLL